MNLVKKITSLLLVLSMLRATVFAEETGSLSLRVAIGDQKPKIEQTELTSDVDNSDLLVEVIKVTKDTEEVIYEGTLGEYENGTWAFTDFSKIRYLVVVEWEKIAEEAIYIIPVTEISNNISSTVPNTILNTETINSSDQVSRINSTQLIEYDVTYSIVSDGSLNMDIDYNVYNGNSENDTVSLIAVLYENGILSDIKTQSLSVNAMESNTDSIILPLPDNRENYSVKLMVWEGFGSLRPIGNTKQVADLDNYTREKYMYVTSNANVGLNVYMNATTVKGANPDAVHTLQYDSSKISAVDLCGFTYNKELTAGEIANTNILVENADLSAGKIEYTFNLQEGRNTGITNLVKFKTLVSLTDEEIIYTIQ